MADGRRVCIRPAQVERGWSVGALRRGGTDPRDGSTTHRCSKAPTGPDPSLTRDNVARLPTARRQRRVAIPTK